MNRTNNKGHCASRLATSLILVLTALFAGAVTQASPASAASSCRFMPYGDIGWYWNLMGGQEFIGCPTSNDEENDLAWHTQQRGFGRIRTFDHGTITWFPFDDRGPFLMMLKQRPGEPVQVNWWDYYNIDGYEVEATPSDQDRTNDPKLAGWRVFRSSSLGTQITMNLKRDIDWQVHIQGCEPDDNFSKCYGYLPTILIRPR